MPLTSRTAINFKHFGKDHCSSMMRIMQTGSEWATIYMERMRLFGKVNGAIVFPEQLLSLKQTHIYIAIGSYEKNKMTLSTKTVCDFHIVNTEYSNKYQWFYTPESILEHERGDGSLFISGRDTSSIMFTKTVGIFTAKRHLCKWITSQMNKMD